MREKVLLSATIALTFGSAAFAARTQITTQTTTRAVHPAYVRSVETQRVYSGRVSEYNRPGLAESEWAFAHPRQAMVQDMHRYAVAVPRKELY